MSLATPLAFKRDPSFVWQFYHYRKERECDSLPHNSCDLTRDSALKVKPNAAHRVLAEFSLSSIRSRHAPNSTFTLITQILTVPKVLGLNNR